ncbi:hypothetical protein AAZX31_03G001500 [Glycine max]
MTWDLGRLRKSYLGSILIEALISSYRWLQRES